MSSTETPSQKPECLLWEHIYTLVHWLLTAWRSSHPQEKCTKCQMHSCPLACFTVAYIRIRMWMYHEWMGALQNRTFSSFFSTKVKHVIKQYIHWCTATIPLSTVLSIIAQITSVIVILNVFSDSIKQNQTIIKTNQLIVV